MVWWEWLACAVGGVLIGALGTLIGAGGGFVLMPVLVLAWPDARPETLASVSLGVVCCNALSGSVGYARRGMIDFNAGRLFLACGVPGAVIGALVTSRLPRSAFDLWLGATLVVIGLAMLIAGPLRRPPVVQGDPAAKRTAAWKVRGGVLSFGVGFVSSLLGIGGGIIHVPAMVYLLRFPVHAATATSHFVLAGTSLAGSVSHVVNGDFSQGGWGQMLVLGAGAAAGAQIGAHYAKRTPPVWILRVLAAALAGVGVRVIAGALGRMP